MRSEAVPDSTWSIRRFLDRLSSSECIPGGASAAALAGALGCSLGSMVGQILLRRPALKPGLQMKIKNILNKTEIQGKRLEGLIREDSLAFRQLVWAQQTHRGLKTARRRAVRSPLQIGRVSASALRTLRGLQPYTGPYLGSDLKVAKALLKGAFEAARVTASMNLLDKRHPRESEDRAFK